MTPRSESGFTIIEIMIAVVILMIGMLGLVMTAAMLSRMMGRSSRAQAASTYASQRLEQMRTAACIPAQRTPGVDSLHRGNAWVAINQWAYLTPGGVNLNNSFWRLQVITTWKTTQDRTHVDTLEMGITCLT